MRTPICDDLGIEFPIFAFTHCRDVVVAVSKAGGFGVLVPAAAELGDVTRLRAEAERVEDARHIMQRFPITLGRHAAFAKFHGLEVNLSRPRLNGPRERMSLG